MESQGNQNLDDPLFDVLYEDQIVGHLSSVDSQNLSFQYTQSWLEKGTPRDGAFPVSLSLPLRRETYSPPVSHDFFVNLLPEGGVRGRLEAHLKVSPGNDIELLRRVGGDCAGALSLVPSGTTSHREQRPGDLRKIDEDALQRWASGYGVPFARSDDETGVRLSLAGAQDKLPVRLQDDAYFLPAGSEPSTHILKFASPPYSYLPENEAFVNLIAKELGLVVPRAWLETVGTQRFLVLERYDREHTNERWRRLHQEDFCQALGVSHRRKYEHEGGPTLKQCAQLLRQHASIPAIEIERLLKWSLFNLLAGNSDAHAKNVSLLWSANGRLTLAPFYDLVCTRTYETLDRHLAMAIGGETDPGRIARRHLHGLGDDLGVRPALVEQTWRDVAERSTDVLRRCKKTFVDTWGTSPVISRVEALITKQVRRTMTLLEREA